MINHPAPPPTQLPNTEKAQSLFMVCVQNFDKAISLKSSVLKIMRTLTGESATYPDKPTEGEYCFRVVLTDTVMELSILNHKLNFITNSCFLSKRAGCEAAGKEIVDPDIPDLNELSLIDIAIFAANLATQASARIANITAMTYIDRDYTHYEGTDQEDTLESVMYTICGNLERALIGAEAYLENLYPGV